jgi:hypothetical protein
VHSEYMGCQGGGLSVDQLADCIRQEFEDLRARKNADQKVSFIPLHYAIRALRKEVARSPTKVTSEVRNIVSEVREFVSQMAHGSNQHREILTNLRAILDLQA